MDWGFSRMQDVGASGDRHPFSLLEVRTTERGGGEQDASAMWLEGAVLLGKVQNSRCCDSPLPGKNHLSLAEQKLSIYLCLNEGSGVRQSWSEMKFFLHKASQVTKVSTQGWKGGLLRGILTSFLCYLTGNCSSKSNRVWVLSIHVWRDHNWL